MAQSRKKKPSKREAELTRELEVQRAAVAALQEQMSALLRQTSSRDDNVASNTRYRDQGHRPQHQRDGDVADHQCHNTDCDSQHTHGDDSRGGRCGAGRRGDGQVQEGDHWVRDGDRQVRYSDRLSRGGNNHHNQGSGQRGGGVDGGPMMDRLRRVAVAEVGHSSRVSVQDGSQQTGRKRKRTAYPSDDYPCKIPKPKGSHGKDFHVNQDYFGLRKDHWLGYTRDVRDATKQVGIDPLIPWPKVEAKRKAGLFKLVRRRHRKLLKPYEADWPTAQIARQSLKNRRKYIRRYGCEPDDDEDEDAPVAGSSTGPGTRQYEESQRARRAAARSQGRRAVDEDTEGEEGEEE